MGGEGRGTGASFLGSSRSGPVVLSRQSRQGWLQSGVSQTLALGVWIR